MNRDLQCLVCYFHTILTGLFVPLALSHTYTSLPHKPVLIWIIQLLVNVATNFASPNNNQIFPLDLAAPPAVKTPYSTFQMLQNLSNTFIQTRRHEQYSINKYVYIIYKTNSPCAKCCCCKCLESMRREGYFLKWLYNSISSKGFRSNVHYTGTTFRPRFRSDEPSSLGHLQFCFRRRQCSNDFPTHKLLLKNKQRF